MSDSTALTLNPESLVVQTFPTEGTTYTAAPKTYEPGCTTPDLCPVIVAAPMKTYEPGCTTPDLCPNGTVAVAEPAAG